MSREWRAFLLGIIGVPAVLAALLFAVYGAETPAILAKIWLRTPLLLSGSADFSGSTGGFAANILISLWAMAIAAAVGAVLGIGLISQGKLIRIPSEFVMNVLRNSPWLVVLYAMLYLLPFE
ncbi:polar amino acid ABC transporter permease, partial [Cupriavidus sp. 2MCAB6]